MTRDFSQIMNEPGDSMHPQMQSERIIIHSLRGPKCPWFFSRINRTGFSRDLRRTK
jgi:hypothetical protein